MMGWVLNDFNVAHRKWREPGDEARFCTYTSPEVIKSYEYR